MLNNLLKTYNATICHNTMKAYKDNVCSKLLKSWPSDQYSIPKGIQSSISKYFENVQSSSQEL